MYVTSEQEGICNLNSVFLKKKKIWFLECCRLKSLTVVFILLVKYLPVYFDIELLFSYTDSLLPYGAVNTAL